MDKVSLIHGAGGEMMQSLIGSVFANIKNNNAGGVGLEALDDGAAIPFGDKYIVLTTDSHVIKPIFFPGGDIGRLSISGTVNDLAMMGARPVALTNGVIIPEGFSMDDLKKIVESVDEALGEVGAALVTGDTKVLPKEALDSILINTAGIGIADTPIRDSGLNPGDVIIVTGTIGDHGISIISHREGFKFGTELRSDCAPIWNTVKAALDVGGVTAMKDPTRGGVANVLNEMASKSHVKIVIEEEALPIRQDVKAAADMLGIDPMEVANEGKAVIGVRADKADETLAAIKNTKYGKDAVIIGTVTEGKGVIMKTKIGGQRFIEPPLGDPVPRVC
ncbi:hydrogenase expression/formation protein HypE [Methanocella sp. CWC-04]|uniref:Hydrogenase expression/formation protein HypE n=1 Tax=Methanooceanicella nereidis TaxID=2052831 RepID=A0AAP2W4L9_9EURY|nr:hydrogenase expression/formation protein HypE [Methanocella sp. CWC-04]MCD1294450.1 hydrogenase expression/formation protein HypE [Methanocella sp. CWC-04]